jgi:hypothetical protein
MKLEMRRGPIAVEFDPDPVWRHDVTDRALEVAHQAGESGREIERLLSHHDIISRIETSEVVIASPA